MKLAAGWATGGAVVALLWSSSAWAEGTPILEARLRYEGVDQAGLTRDADALTLRTRLGWETSAWQGFKALVEIENVSRIGAERFNVAVPGVPGASLNGRTRYPIVNDPDVTEVNRAQIAWSRGPGLSVVVGRQRINIDDQRFIGGVAWRQDEQTFDAARVDFARGKFKATYIYIDRVNRVLGDDRDWRSDSHLVNVSYAASDLFRAEGFAYLLDFSNAETNSSQTYGAKASGKAKSGAWNIAYNATYATQSQYRGSAAPFDLDYWGGDLSVSRGIWTGRASYEALQGDGTRGFIMPLSTAHMFQGWADAFAAVGGNKTSVDGIRDVNLQLVARPKLQLRHLSKVELLARWHDFAAERASVHLGHEWDLQATASLSSKVVALVKFARFEAASSVRPGFAAPPASRSKVWVSLEYRL